MTMEKMLQKLLAGSASGDDLGDRCHAQSVQCLLCFAGMHKHTRPKHLPSGTAKAVVRQVASMSGRPGKSLSVLLRYPQGRLLQVLLHNAEVRQIAHAKVRQRTPHL
jgi:hypothetical protein